MRSVYYYTHLILLLKLWKDLPLDGDGPCKGMYYHPIIQKAINAMWFQNKRDAVPVSIPAVPDMWVSVAISPVGIPELPYMWELATVSFCKCD